MGGEHNRSVLAEGCQSPPKSTSTKWIDTRRALVNQHNYQRVVSGHPFQTPLVGHDSLLEPPNSPIANCNFLFCPPLKLFAFDPIFLPRSQSLSNPSKSSSGSELGDHLTALHTRKVCRQVSSGKRTFFWGTRPIVPRGGRRWPPSKMTSPEVWPVRPPTMDIVVDFPALYPIVSRHHSKECLRRAYPLEPRRTNIPVFGTSKLRLSMAVTLSLELQREPGKTFLRLRTEMAIFPGTTASVVVDVLAQNFHQGLVELFGTLASYSLRSQRVAMYGHRKMLI
jgi:hypothetical protein